MTRPKRLATFRVVFLDCHVGIAKTNDLFFAFIASLYNRLLAARDLALRYIALHL